MHSLGKVNKLCILRPCLKLDYGKAIIVLFVYVDTFLKIMNDIIELQTFKTYLINTFADHLLKISNTRAF